MSWLCWNVRELGNRRTVQELEALIRAQDPAALFLAEMWADEDRLLSLCNKINFNHSWIVPRVNSTGCLSLFLEKFNPHQSAFLLAEPCGYYCQETQRGSMVFYWYIWFCGFKKETRDLVSAPPTTLVSLPPLALCGRLQRNTVVS